VGVESGKDIGAECGIRRSAAIDAGDFNAEEV
jgi:hypothetical protein